MSETAADAITDRPDDLGISPVAPEDQIDLASDQRVVLRTMVDMMGHLLDDLHTSPAELGYEDVDAIASILFNAHYKIIRGSLDIRKILPIFRQTIDQMKMARERLRAVLTALASPTAHFTQSEIVHDAEKRRTYANGVNEKRTQQVLKLIRREIFDMPLLSGKGVISDFKSIDALLPAAIKQAKAS